LLASITPLTLGERPLATIFLLDGNVGMMEGSASSEVQLATTPIPRALGLPEVTADVPMCGATAGAADLLAEVASLIFRSSACRAIRS
jgi:hypothetical protein